MQDNFLFRKISIITIFLWLFFFALLPFALVVVASFLSHGHEHLIQLPFTFEHYRALNNSLYLRVFEKSFELAGICTLICLIIGYPFAYILAKIQGAQKSLLLLLVIIPFWTSSLIRSYALMALMKAKGLINSTLIFLGLLHQPISLLFTNTAVMIGLVYNLLPFMILPLLTNIERLDTQLIDAARDLGATRFIIMTRIVIPLTIQGIIAGSTLVFLPAMTLFYIPDILGGAKSILLGNLIQNQFLLAQNWPMGATLSTMLTIILIFLMGLYWFSTRHKQLSGDDWL